MQSLHINGYKIKVFLCDDGFWKHDTVFIYNNSKCIAEKEIHVIMDYLSMKGLSETEEPNTMWQRKKNDQIHSHNCS